ncbi:MAG: XdhC family protein [Terracidiphilus sp.]|jgi:xanthine/CO dehydrogenase XdhC/CoxF family maturation factor
MTDVDRILTLWRELESASADYVLATVVEVQGSSYRKPGALMLLAPDGRRAGTVSGGCLEAQVAQRAWWLTASGPTIQRYSTAEEDGELPYGSGCGGVIFLLLERRATADAFLRGMEQAFRQRLPLAIATVLEGPQLGRRAFAKPACPASRSNGLQDLAAHALEHRVSMERIVSVDGIEFRAWANFRPARPGLCIFGAGDDAQPLLHLARELGWFVAIADGRSHLITRERFPTADAVHLLVLPNPSDVSDPAAPAGHTAPSAHGASQPFADLRPHDAAVIMTHSFQQDAHILSTLLALDPPIAYIGVLGPQRRTRELLAESAPLLHPASASATDAQIDRWLARLHAPMGLDLGAESPTTIALSVVSEIQKSLTDSSALPLREVRARSAALTVPS